MKKIKPKIRESDLQKQILEWLNLQGHYAWKTNAGTMFIQGKNGMRCFRCGFKGLSDIIGIMRDGRMIAVECKAKYGKASREQLQFLEEIRCRGGIGLVAKDLDNVIFAIKEI